MTEAQILCKPVIVTAYPTAASQIKQGKDGLIVPMDSPEVTAKAMAKALRNTPLREHILTYLQANDYGNAEEVEKIHNLIGAIRQ